MQVPGSPRLWLAAVPVLAAFAVTGLAVVLAEGEGGDGEDAGGAIESFQLPRERGGCAGSIGASIGHRDPRGFPVLDRARLDSIDDVAVGAGEARVRATITTRLAGRAQPSVEERPDLPGRHEGEWRISAHDERVIA